MGTFQRRSSMTCSGVSVSSCGSTYLWGRARRWTFSPGWFQYPRVDRLICGQVRAGRAAPCQAFQYPRVDRLICGDLGNSLIIRSSGMFQYPRVDRLICGGGRATAGAARLAGFSILVWIDLFVGAMPVGIGAAVDAFQYPRVDRLICGVCGSWLRFPLLLCFSILVWIDLFVGDILIHLAACGYVVSVSSCGSTYLWGNRHAQRLIAQRAVSVSSCGSTYLWGSGWLEIDDPGALFQYPRVDRLICGASDIN